MPRRLWPPVVMLVLGASLIAVAAGNSFSLRKGGVFRVAAVGPSVKVDPQVAYITTAWWLEYATAAKLFNYPDKAGYAGALLQPEVAFSYRISKSGKVYSFTIRKGFRFSDGKPVTGQSFVYAIDRVLDSRINSPALPLITDPSGAEVVDYFAKGDKLIIKLKKPDPTFATKLAMPFFQATSTKLPRSTEVRKVKNIKGMPTAGPYAFARVVPDKVTRIARNPYWTTGPGRHRPRHLAGLEITWNEIEETAYQQTLANKYDEGPLPVANVQEVATRFGVNKTRFWVKPLPCLGYLALNNSNGLFAGNPSMRKAVNFALDRTDYAAQAGPYAQTPFTHILPPGVPGSRTEKPYPVRSNIEKAKTLAAGHFKDGKIIVAYRSSGTIGPPQAELIRNELIALGFDPGNITMTGYDGVEPPAQWDLLMASGWCADVADPYGFFQLLAAPSPAVFDNAKYRKKIAAAAKLAGEARMNAFGKLDLEIMRNAAPLAPMNTYNNRYFFSNRVDPHSLVYQGVYSDWSIPALALK